MKMYVLYNPKSNNGNGEAGAQKVKDFFKDKEIELVDAFSKGGYKTFVDSIEENDEICLCGGDGTLNRFVNDVDCDALKNNVYYYPSGSGNDFWNDLEKTKDDAPELINKYIKGLPTVTVNGKTSKFINGIGYGIDGYCCEEGDILREKSDKPINYTSIAIKGMIYKYKPTNAEITVDGEKITLKKAWLAPTMKGRFYGGGMMATPHQNRLDPEGKVTTMVMSGGGRLRTLVAFPSIFKGEHVNKKMVHVMKGKNVKVKFDRPVALQIDGETVLNVTEYTVNA